MTQLKRSVGLDTAWTRLNDYDKARWKLTGMYILVFFVLLNLFTISLFVILQKVESNYIKKTDTVWQQKKIVFPDSNITILEWNTNNNGLSKQEVVELHKNFLTDIKHWIVIIELILLVLAGVVSYFLAGKTLKPIKIKSELQKQFLADVSHELKNPLSSLKINLEVAKKQDNLSNSEVKEIFGDLEEEVERLNQMTQDLLALEDVNGKNQKVNYDVKTIITNQISLLELLAKKRNIKIQPELENFVVKVDKKSIEQIVFNLLHNAIKFSHPNSKIKIILTNKGLISISDKGIGIEEKDLPHIFKRFYKADISRTFAQDNGSGLGLSIVKKIADGNGWRLNVKSEKEKGTTFEVYLR